MLPLIAWERRDPTQQNKGHWLKLDCSFIEIVSKCTDAKGVVTAMYFSAYGLQFIASSSYVSMAPYAASGCLWPLYCNQSETYFKGHPTWSTWTANWKSPLKHDHTQSHHVHFGGCPNTTNTPNQVTTASGEPFGTKNTNMPLRNPSCFCPTC